MKKLEFPDSFTWGAATAAYQIEGAVNEDGRAPSIWDTFAAIPGKIKNGDSGAIADDHYHRYRDDVAMMVDLGLDAYRFSIAWPRVLPQGTGPVNQAGLDFYDRLVDELLGHYIQPWVTLYHWDLPQALEDRGGWPDRAIVDAFVEYADLISRTLSDRVQHWITVNEPWVFTYMGYGSGQFPPGRANMTDFLMAMHHQFLAHARATEIIRSNGDALTQVGTTLNLYQIDAASDREADIAAARRQDGFMNRLFLDPLYRGSYPADTLALFGGAVPDFPAQELDEIKGAPDFLGMNYYSRQVVADNPDDSGPIKARTVRQAQSEHTATDWEVAPESLYRMLKRLKDDYAPEAIVITENGAAYDDAIAEDGAVHDEQRVAFFKAYLAQAHRAIEDGVPLKAYFAWSLMDNFEWTSGYSKRFGIVYVDYATQRRIPKDSATWYSRTIKQNGFMVED